MSLDTKSIPLVAAVVVLILAGVFMMNAIGGGRLAYAFADKLGGEKGRELVDVSIGTIRSVVKGVLLVALIQGLLSAIGLAILVVLFRNRQTINVADLDDLKG